MNTEQYLADLDRRMTRLETLVPQGFERRFSKLEADFGKLHIDMKYMSTHLENLQIVIRRLAWLLVTGVGAAIIQFLVKGGFVQ